MSRDPGLIAALDAAGGVRPLARAIGLRHQSVAKWETVPQDRLMAVAEATRQAAEILRPDLEDWILAEKVRRRMAASKQHYSLVRAAVGVGEVPKADADTLMMEMLIAHAAARFAARERDLAFAHVLVGRRRPEMGARAWAMALAHVAGRCSSSAIGVFYGTSRQNVDNASERYLRARDGDDPDDFLAGERVIERGRLRAAKTAATDLWAAEARFTALLQGQNERKRA